ncbi:MAG TPA: zf-HC2 domain-containing protein [Anaerolineae bacterium]|nr:zf-HC2 domain-containing protein [Anaerolineae bacterium]
MFRRRNDETRNHNYFEERLSAYLDGELATRERRAVEQHLKACERCRWELATLKQTVAWLAELPAVPLPRVFAIPANVVPAPPVRRRSFVPAMQFATAMVAVLLFFAAAGDVMLTGWPWGTTAEPMMMQEVAVERTVADAPAAGEAEVTLEVEAATYTEPYGMGGAAAATAPAAADATLAGAAEKESAPAEESVAAEAPEEAPMALQAAPEDSAQETALAEPATGEGVGGGEATDEQVDATEEVARVQADTPPVAQATPAPGALPVDTPEPLPTAAPEALPTATDAPRPTTRQAPAAAIVPTPTALPTIHPPATAAQEPPAALVQAPEPAARSGEVRDESEPSALTGGDTSWAVFWLRVVEYVLGVALVVLTGATIALMVWRRWARGR